MIECEPVQLRQNIIEVVVDCFHQLWGEFPGAGPEINVQSAQRWCEKVRKCIGRSAGTQTDMWKALQSREKGAAAGRAGEGLPQGIIGIIQCSRMDCLHTSSIVLEGVPLGIRDVP